MKKNIIVTLLIALTLNAQTNCDLCPPDIDVGTNTIETTDTNFSVVFFFNTSTNDVSLYWSNYIGRIDIMYSTNLSIPSTNWDCKTNIQMSKTGIYVGDFPYSNCFFLLKIIPWCNNTN